MTGSIPISQLNNEVTVKLSNLLVAVDTTDVSMAPTGTTENVFLWQIVNLLFSYFGFPSYASVQAATTANLTATYNNGTGGIGATLTNSGTQVTLYIDSYTTKVGDRILVKNQTTPAQNGIYTVTSIGSAMSNWVLTRATDLNQGVEFINGNIVVVIQGATQANTIWQLSCAATFVVGTTPDYWNEFVIVPSQLLWTDVTAVSVNALVNNGYIADRSATPVQVLLPPTFNIGDTIIVMGKGTGGWSLVANAGQTIVFGTASTSVAGAINSDIQYGNIQVRGLISGTTWEVTSVFGNPSYV